MKQVASVKVTIEWREPGGPSTSTLVDVECGVLGGNAVLDWRGDELFLRINGVCNVTGSGQGVPSGGVS